MLRIVLCALCTLALLTTAHAQPVEAELPPLPPPPVYQVQQAPPVFQALPVAARPSLPSRSFGGRWDCPPITLLHLTHLAGGYTMASTGPRQAILELRLGLLCVQNARGSAKDVGLHLIPELGFTLLFATRDEDEAAAPSSRLASLGLSVGIGNRWASLAYDPRVLLGASAGAPAFGLRHGVVVRLCYEILSAEVSHQVLFTAAGPRNDLVLMGGVNALVFLAALANLR